MTENAFRKRVFGLSDAVESAHMDHLDVRVGGRVFANVGPERSGRGMVQRTPPRQAAILLVDATLT